VNLFLALTFGIPTLIQGYVLGLLSLTIGFTRRPYFDGPVLVTESRPWVERWWHFTTTIAAWMIIPTWFNERTRFHENHHLRQYIDLNVLAFVLAACLLPWLGWKGSLILWGTSGALWLVPNFITAGIRYWRPGVSFMDAVYRQSSHEDHAYDSTDVEYR
jgi:hypothetical protein